MKKLKNLFRFKIFKVSPLWSLLLLLMAAECPKHEVQSCDSIYARDQDEFNKADAKSKQKWIMFEHNKSVGSWFGGFNQNATYASSYIMGKYYEVTNELLQAIGAADATIQFILPDISKHIERYGAKPITHTLIDQCDAFKIPKTKKVHALASMASGRMVILNEVLPVKSDGSVDTAVKGLQNPYTGLWGPQPEARHIPLVARFSIANPVVPNSKEYEKVGKVLIDAANKAKKSLDPIFMSPFKDDINSLDLEFIPGLGLKFFVDGQKSLDLVAMDSLAGQFDANGKPDQNYFKYEFSHDFSKHAPLAYNTATGEELEQITSRYAKNPGNHLVMTLVGKRFEEAMGYAGYKVADPHSRESANPFVMAISPHASVDVAGNKIDAHQVKRPWRIVFKPALRSVEPIPESQQEQQYRVYKLEAPSKGSITPYEKQIPLANDGDEKKRKEYDQLISSSLLEKDKRVERDFRAKLSHLPPGTVTYDVLAETKEGKRFLIGYVLIDDVPYPSDWSDKQLFIKHDIETQRFDPEYANTVVEPK